MIEASPYDSRGYQVLKVETHLHTLHSDGQDGVTAMFEACRSAGYVAVALTDHNTQTGLAEAERAADQLELILLPGVEVTTFRGHAVALGITGVPEWRDLEERGVDDLARAVHADGGLICVAHASAFGSPVCSGCAWEWQFDPLSIDLWEVFSAPRPIADTALALWRQTVERGGWVAPLAAGDVHSVGAASRLKMATHVYARDRSAGGVLDALRERRVFASTGGRLDLWLQGDAGEVALAGSRVPAAAWTPHVTGGGIIVDINLEHGGRCVYAERRAGDQRLEAISAPIWIDTSH